MRLKSGTIPFSQADQNILKEQQSNDTNVPRDEFLAPVHHSDASVLMEQRKLTIKIRYVQSDSLWVFLDLRTK